MRLTQSGRIVKRFVHSKSKLVSCSEIDIYLDKSVFLGDGEIFENDDGVCLACTPHQGAFQFRFVSKRPFLSNSIAVRFKVSGWRDLKYVAVGFTSGQEFCHVKIPHVSQSQWLDFKFAFHDLVFLIQNRWQLKRPCAISDLRIFVKGVPVTPGGIVSVAEVGFFLEEDASPEALLNGAVGNKLLIEYIYSYWRACYKDYAHQADEFLNKGSFPVYGEINLNWSPLDADPADIMELNTFRFSRHAFHSLSMLLLRFEDTTNQAFIHATREFLGVWLESSFFQPDKDQKYTWYDHGAAERTLAFLAIFHLCHECGFDFRYKNRIAYVLFKHADLLYSEAFYASHQLKGYHNHAWFQDITLIATSISLHHLEGSRQWLEKGFERLNEQLAHLIRRESGYAVFVENSIGYHQGVQRLVGFAGQLESLAGRGSGISTIANELDAWSQHFRYPDGRSPAQGDTFRKANPKARGEVVLPAGWEAQVLCLPQAGYAVIKGGDSSCPWMFGLLGTNLSSTHKHEDDLSCFLWLDGVEWLIDPSFVSHEYADAVPAYLRSARAHNMLSVEGLDYSFEPAPGRVVLHIDEAAEAAKALEVTGHNRSCKGFEVVRRLQCHDEHGVPAIRSSDHFQGQPAAEPHTDPARGVVGLLTFHFGDGVRVSMARNGPQTVVELTHPASSRSLTLVIGREHDQHIWDGQLEASMSGLGFMQQIETQALRVRLPVSTACLWSIDVK